MKKTIYFCDWCKKEYAEGLPYHLKILSTQGEFDIDSRIFEVELYQNDLCKKCFEKLRRQLNLKNEITELRDRQELEKVELEDCCSF